MTIYKPPQRLLELGMVLKYDSELQEDGKTKKLEPHEREAINRERAKVIANDYSYQHFESLITKIDSILLEIKLKRWKPKNPIEYTQRLKYGKLKFNDLEL